MYSLSLHSNGSCVIAIQQQTEVWPPQIIPHALMFYLNCCSMNILSLSPSHSFLLSLSPSSPRFLALSLSFFPIAIPASCHACFLSVQFCKSFAGVSSLFICFHFCLTKCTHSVADVCWMFLVIYGSNSSTLSVVIDTLELSVFIQNLIKACLSWWRFVDTIREGSLSLW